MYLVLPAGHPMAAKRNVGVRDVAEEAWILGSADASCPDSQILMRACNAAGFEPRIAFQSDDYNAIQGFVAAGVGVCLIPDLALTNVRRDVVVRSLGPKAPVRRISAISTAGRLLLAGQAGDARHPRRDRRCVDGAPPGARAGVLTARVYAAQACGQHPSMSGSVYFAVIALVVMLVLSIAMSPLFIIPLVVVVLFLAMSGPLLGMLRRTGTQRSSGGTPRTSDAAYEPVAEPQERGAV